MSVYIPANASDVIMHVKDANDEERVMFPVTRYQNLMSAPSIVKDGDDTPGAPYHLLEMDEEEVDITELRKLCGNII